ncbi:glutathione S-transferase omega-1 isoform X2 [Octodon degus]|uniref:Glutathione S-transferase omega n=1 Tax=Octodon degus TaxID=10160 RepID=A0A6P6EGC4_OCTDE|nr:glutathione S-transferase omega-1 isoform X2 [Octodon degus]
MSARTLSAGSPPPGPVPQGAVRVYSMRFCPYAQRVLLVLMTKGIRHEVVNINLKNKPEWFLEKNPLGLVPVLENSQGQLISDSVIICDYLDEAFPGKKLVPDDPYEKACQRMILELFSKVPSLRVSIIRLLHKKEDCSDVQEELKKELNKLDEVGSPDSEVSVLDGSHEARSRSKSPVHGFGVLPEFPKTLHPGQP